jgi:hypothetical protein
LCSVSWIIICPLSFDHYMVCLSTNGLWVVLWYLKTVTFSWITQITRMNNVGYKPLHFHCKAYLVHTMRLYICVIYLHISNMP